MLSDNDKLKKVLDARSRLIDDLDRCVLTKKQFQDENYRILTRYQMKPYAVIETPEQGIYNYQFYNTMAKEYQRRLQCAQHRKKASLEQAVRNYFCMKDDCIRQMLHLCAHEPVEAYLVHAASAGMKNRLLEIVFLRREKVILHTLNPKILSQVRRMGIFRPQVRVSLINNYVNSQNEEVAT